MRCGMNESGYTPSRRRRCRDTLRAMSYQSINPYNGELVKSFVEHTDQQLETFIVTAVMCFDTWRKLDFVERASIVSKAAGIMRERADEFARPMTLEMGKLYAE